MLGLALLLVPMMLQEPSTALGQYVQKPQPDFAWRQIRSWKEGAFAFDEYALVSQKWQGLDWKHDLIRVSPVRTHKSVANNFLVVTGDRVDRVDLPFAEKLAMDAGVPVWTLFNVPNQPLFEKREDDLIAYSFGEYLETGDAEWPLLLPMANSVIKAMDTIDAATHGSVKGFYVTGESKRGWTTWLAAATGDPRIRAIAPVAFDNVSFAAQLQHQMDSWGRLSEMLASYSGPGLTEEAKSEGGQKLLQIVDPYSYLQNLKTPVMVIRGANDPYWAADAASVYWNQIVGPKAFVNLPNEGHDFQSDEIYIRSLADVSKPVSFGKCEAVYKDRAFHCKWGERLKSVALWKADSDSKDFRQSKWVKVFEESAGTQGSKVVSVPSSKSKFEAVFMQFTKEGGSVESSLVQIVAPTH